MPSLVRSIALSATRTAIPFLSTMSHHHHGIPVLSYDNFDYWEIQVISFLTGASDHVRVIEPCHDATGRLVDPVCPTDAGEKVKWGLSEREALGIIMSTASGLHHRLILKHRASGEPVYKLWTKICCIHQSHATSFRHQIWLEFFSSRKSPDESYAEFVWRKEGLLAKIDRLTPESQTKAERAAELTLVGILLGLPIDDHIRQALTSQPNLTLDRAKEEMIRCDTRKKPRHAGSEWAPATHCRKCDAPGHHAQDCTHSGTIKDLVIKRNAASRSATRNRRWVERRSKCEENASA